MLASLLLCAFGAASPDQASQRPRDEISASIARALVSALQPDTPALQVFERTDALTTERGRRTRAFDMLVICSDWDFSVRSSQGGAYRVTTRRFPAGGKPVLERGDWRKPAVVGLFEKLDDQCEGVSIGIGTLWNVGVGLTSGRVASASASPDR